MLTRAEPAPVLRTDFAGRLEEQYVVAEGQCITTVTVTYYVVWNSESSGSFTSLSLLRTLNKF